MLTSPSVCFERARRLFPGSDGGQDATFGRTGPCMQGPFRVVVLESALQRVFQRGFNLLGSAVEAVMVNAKFREVSWVSPHKQWLGQQGGLEGGTNRHVRGEKGSHR